MRVLFVSTSSGSQGGGEFYIVYLAEALAGTGVDVGLWVSDDSSMDGIAEMFSRLGTVLRSPYVNTFKRWTRSFSHCLPLSAGMDAILSEWKSFNPDVLHLNKQCLEDGLDLLKLANRWDIPQGCTIHITQSASSLKAFLGAARDRIARNALRSYHGELWAIARNRLDDLEGFLGRGDNLRCIPNGVSIPDKSHIESESFRMRDEWAQKINGSGPVAVSVGRLMEQKDPFRFLEILEKWKSKEPGLTGIWVGDGWLREEFEKRIAEMGAQEWIHCVGWQKSAAPYLCMADVYVHPARFEGLPFALLEAMAHGLPCVISPTLARDLKDMPESKWITAEDDPNEWLPKVTDPGLLKRKGMELRQLAEERFSVEAMANAYIRIYEEIMAGKETA